MQNLLKASKSTWIGRALSALPVALLLFSGVMKLTVRTPEMLEGLSKVGWSEAHITPLGILELCCTLLYIIPKTAAVGAILLTGYMGGAIATHLRIGDPIVMQVFLPILVWLGLYLREPRLHSLLPFRKTSL